MRKIVTVDFDIIMGPSIEVYNHFIPFEKTWDELDLNPQIRLSEGDYFHYQRITEWLIEMTKYIPKEKIHFIGSHDTILNYLEEGIEYDIINIDHHHDCGYKYDNSLYKTADLDCTNWVAVAYDKGMIGKYSWLKNEESTFISLSAKKITTMKCNFKDYNLDMMPIPEEIYICFSDMWIPPHIRPLFFTWMDIFNRIYNTKFEVE